MSQVFTGHSYTNPFHGTETLKRCRNNEDGKNVVLIDEDTDNVNNYMAEPLPKKPRGPSNLSNVILIDDDEDETPVNSGVVMNNNVSSIGNSYAGTAVEEGDCDIMEDLSGKVQEQWEKASSKRRKDVNNSDSGVASASKLNNGYAVPSSSLNLESYLDFSYVFDNPIVDDYSLDSLLRTDFFPQSDSSFIPVEDFCTSKAFPVENENKYQSLFDPLENMQWCFEKIPLPDLNNEFQAEEAQRIRRLREKKEAEIMHQLDIQKRQKERLEEINNSQKQDEEKLKSKEVIRAEVKNYLKNLEVTCLKMSHLLQCLGISVGGWPYPLPQQVQIAYKTALLTFHPDRASRSDIRQQVEAEEKFKLVNRFKEKFPLML